MVVKFRAVELMVATMSRIVVHTFFIFFFTLIIFSFN